MTEPVPSPRIDTGAEQVTGQPYGYPVSAPSEPGNPYLSPPSAYPASLPPAPAYGLPAYGTPAYGGYPPYPVTAPPADLGKTAVAPKTGNALRTVVALILVLAVVVLIGVGMALNKPAGEIAQFLSPLTGLAGLALGYWFGAEKR